MSRESLRKIELEMRRDRAFELSQAGSSPSEIANELGVTHNTVLRYLEARREAEASKDSEEVELQLAMQVVRIQALIATLYRQVMEGDESLQTTIRIVQLMEKEAKLLGLDAPKQMQHSEPDGDPEKKQEQPDFSAFTDEELDLFLELVDKIKFDDDTEHKGAVV
ncbi:MAG: helix-turn-helix domain-containing protein [Caldilineaceae bacterium]|nr:helix-turn-helix domain-containing protein [Caldilineaceae bacterium]MDE0336662.1 helix-turn-helix domain-containing protein [Caldilineaceae bacterium]